MPGTVSFSALTLLIGRQERHPACIREWQGNENSDLISWQAQFFFTSEMVNNFAKLLSGR